MATQFMCADFHGVFLYKGRVTVLPTEDNIIGDIYEYNKNLHIYLSTPENPEGEWLSFSNTELASRISIVTIDNIDYVALDGQPLCPLAALQAHESADAERWQLQADSDAAMLAQFATIAQNIYDGSQPPVDTTQPTTIIGTGGLISLGASDGYTITQNGYIQCVYKTIIGAVIIVNVNDVPVFTTAIGLLGSHTSDYIQVSTGDIITSSGLLSLGGGLNVTFYPNKQTSSES